MKKRLPLIIALLVAVSALVVWRSRRGEFLYAGTIEATEVDLSARVGSQIAEFAAEEGRDVAAGQVLVRLACEDVRLALRQADRDFQRARTLHGKGTLSDEAFENVRFRRDDAALKVDWCEVRAPEGATVLRTYREPGELVTPNTRLLTLGNLNEVWAMIYVPEPLLAKLSLGLEVEGFLPEVPGGRFKGRIAVIRDEAEFTPKNVQTQKERTRLVYGVKVVFPNPGKVLKPGMTIEARLPQD